MIYSEQLESRSITVDANNTAVGTRVWFIDNPDLVSSSDLFKSSVIDWQTFPGLNALPYASHAVTLSPQRSGTILTARYSNNASGKIPVNVREFPLSRESSSRRIEALIPINVEVVYPTEVTPFSVDVWKSIKIPDNATHPERIFVVKIVGGTELQFDAAYAQVDNIHKINGEALLLLDATVRREASDRWLVTYRYLADKGTKAETLPSRLLFVHPDNRAATGLDTVSNVMIEEYWRLPFERLEPYDSDDPTVSPHPCISKRPEYVPNGHLTMPGGNLFGAF